MTHRNWLIALSLVATASCKSRYGFTNQNKEGATTSNSDATPNTSTLPKPNTSTQTTTTTTTTNTTPTTSTNPTSSTTPAVETAPTSPGGPVAGIEVWQEGVLVSSIQTGKPVQFKPTSWTRDTSATSGCEINRGIVQGSWTIGSRAASDIQRYAGQDCRLFDYSGTFTKPGDVVVKFDVVSAEGEQAHAETTLKVTGDVITAPTTPSPVGTTPTPSDSPAQQ